MIINQIPIHVMGPMCYSLTDIRFEQIFHSLFRLFRNRTLYLFITDSSVPVSPAGVCRWNQLTNNNPYCMGPCLHVLIRDLWAPVMIHPGTRALTVYRTSLPSLDCHQLSLEGILCVLFPGPALSSAHEEPRENLITAPASGTHHGPPALCPQ